MPRRALIKDLTDLFTLRSVDDDMVGNAIPCAVKHGLSSAACPHIAALLELQRLCREADDKLVLISADDEQCKATKEEGNHQPAGCRGNGGAFKNIGGSNPG